MEENEFHGPGYPKDFKGMKWGNLFLEDFIPFERVCESYDFLTDYSKIHNLYPAGVPQPNPFSNKVMFLIDTLTRMNVKYTIDIFEHSGSKINWSLDGDFAHKLVNIIVEPNPNVVGPATVFVAHHDVMNVRSDNCQDNGASVCNLLRLVSLIKAAPEESKRTIVLFSDAEECGLRGANQFAKKGKKSKDNPAIIEHEIYGEISAVINLELSGKGKVLWSDCESKDIEKDLHELLENNFGKAIPKLKTPPSDAIAFRRHNYPVLCIGILPEDDMKHKDTWRLCHSLKDTIEMCNRKDMEDFTQFLFNVTKIRVAEHGVNIEADKTTGPVLT